MKLPTPSHFVPQAISTAIVYPIAFSEANERKSCLLRGLQMLEELVYSFGEPMLSRCRKWKVGFRPVLLPFWSVEGQPTSFWTLKVHKAMSFDLESRCHRNSIGSVGLPSSRNASHRLESGSITEGSLLPHFRPTLPESNRRRIFNVRMENVSKKSLNGNLPVANCSESSNAKKGANDRRVMAPSF